MDGRSRVPRRHPRPRPDVGRTHCDRHLGRSRTEPRSGARPERRRLLEPVPADLRALQRQRPRHPVRFRRAQARTAAPAVPDARVAAAARQQAAEILEGLLGGHRQPAPARWRVDVRGGRADGGRLPARESHRRAGRLPAHPGRHPRRGPLHRDAAVGARGGADRRTRRPRRADGGDLRRGMDRTHGAAGPLAGVVVQRRGRHRRGLGHQGARAQPPRDHGRVPCTAGSAQHDRRHVDEAHSRTRLGLRGNGCRRGWAARLHHHRPRRVHRPRHGVRRRQERDHHRASARSGQQHRAGPYPGAGGVRGARRCGGPVGSDRPAQRLAHRRHRQTRAQRRDHP